MYVCMNSIPNCIFLLLQKLDFCQVRDWRKSREKFATTAAKRGNIVDTLRNHAVPIGSTLRPVTCFPCEVTPKIEVMPCCTVAFCKLYGISTKTKAAYWQIVLNGAEVDKLEQSELNLAKNEGRKQQTLLWMKDTFHLLCDILPTTDYCSKNYHLPKCMSKTTIHKEYWTEFQAKKLLYGADYKPYARTTFAKLWLEEYPYVQIPDHMAFSVCAHCSSLHDRLITATKMRDVVVLKKVQQLRREHLRFVGAERLTYRSHQQLARDEPDRYVCLTIDGMDQAKLRGPHFAGGGVPKGVFRSNSFIHRPNFSL
jgi:hypothetical protein